jgi:hypothetical protein
MKELILSNWPSLALLCLSAIPAALMHAHDHGKWEGWGKPTGFFGSKQWTRKYKSNPAGANIGVVMADKEGNLVPAFWGSTTIFSLFTDSYHASQALMRILMSLSITLAISAPWWSFMLIWVAYATVHAAFYKILSR